MLPGKGARRARTAGKPGQMAGKVPVIMQMEALECGAACLAMIAAYYGKWVPLEQVRADCGVSRDGSKASNVVRAARAYGFEASGSLASSTGTSATSWCAAVSREARCI